MMKKTLLLSTFLIISTLLFSQYRIDSLMQSDTIRFDSFAAAGLNPAPAPGELNSANWRFTGFSDGNTQFGGLKNTGDFARGVSTGGVTTGGIYAFDNGITGTILGVQPTNDDFTPGRITFKIQNNTGQVIQSLNVNYDVWFLNNENKASSFNLYFSSDDTTYYQDTTLKVTTVETADTMGWDSHTKVATLNSVNIAVGDIFYLQWRSADVSGTGGRDEFGLDDIVIEVEASNGTPTAEVQFIHNSADTMLNSVDVYLDGVKKIDDFGYRNATPYLQTDAFDSLRVHISPSNSVDTNSAYWSGTMFLNDGQEYVAIINGLVGSGYNPPATVRPLDLFLHSGKEVSEFIGNTEILFFHGSTDLGPIDVVETSLPAGTIIDNIEYAEFNGYDEYLTDDYTIDIMDSTSSNVLYNFQLDLTNRNLLDSAIVALSSGFHNPSANNNGAVFDIMYAPAQGGSLISLMNGVTSLQENTVDAELKIYPNPVKDYLMVETKLKDAEISIYTMDGREIYAQKINAEKENINISTLPKGIFLLKLTSEKGSWNKVFVRK